MPPDAGMLGISDVLTIIGMLVGFGLQYFVGLRWLVKQFDERDAALATAIAERNRELQAIIGRMDGHKEYGRNEISRVDRDLANLRERIAVLPSREVMDQLLRERVGPMEQDLRTLVIQLAARGLSKGSAGAEPWQP